MTRPSSSTSGPPELPGLIAASVWIAPEIWKSVSDSIERSTAETTPTDSDCFSPNGEPIAATGVPTSTSRLEPSGSGRSFSPPVSIRSIAMSAFGSAPTILASTWLPSANSTKTWLARRARDPSPWVTTCALVAISPSALSTKPEPTPPPPSPPPPSTESRLSSPKSDTTVTTPGASCS